MTPIALKALKGSIRKWEQIVAGLGEDNGTENCPLCKVYYGKGCRGCPVFKATGERECRDSPYQVQWLKLNCDRAMTDEQIVAAANELRFLISLLPENTNATE